eukprot:m.306535 g.306535  ORF g.306535 m.306535 type:complete len:333 (+) comp41334_c0_seq1:171-1169(+)
MNCLREPSRGLKRKRDLPNETSMTTTTTDRISYDERQAIWGMSMTKLTNYQADGYQQLHRAVLVWQTMRSVFQSYHSEKEGSSEHSVASPQENPTAMPAENVADLVVGGQLVSGHAATEDSGDEEEVYRGESDDLELMLGNLDVYMETGGDNEKSPEEEREEKNDVDDGKDEAPDERAGSKEDTETKEEGVVVVVGQNQNKRVCVYLYDSNKERGSRVVPNNTSTLLNHSEDFCGDDEQTEATSDYPLLFAGDDEGDNDKLERADVETVTAESPAVNPVWAGNDSEGDEDFLTVLIGRNSLRQKSVYNPCSLEATTCPNSANRFVSVKVLEN